MKVVMVGQASEFFKRPSSSDVHVTAAYEAISGIQADAIRLRFPEGSDRPRYFDVEISGHVVRLGARRVDDAIEIARIHVSKR